MSGPWPLGESGPIVLLCAIENCPNPIGQPPFHSKYWCADHTKVLGHVNLMVTAEHMKRVGPHASVRMPFMQFLARTIGRN